MSDETARTPERRTGWSVSRRRALQLGGGLAGAAVAAPSAAGPRSRAATITEGTNTMVAVSPDGRRLVLDLLTAIWVLDARGGTARRLTDDLQDASRPRWSPDGRLIAFQSYADGNYHLWTIRPDGTGLRQHTRGRYDHREPCFTPDGAALVFSSDRGGDSYGVFRLDLATGAVTALTDTAVEEAEPVVAAGRVAFTVDAASIDEIDLATGARRTVVPAQQGSTVYGPAYSPDGTLAYVRLTGPHCDLMVDGAPVTSGKDVFALPPSWASATELFYTADGQVVRHTVGGGHRVVPFRAEVPVTASRPEPVVPDLTSTTPRPVLGSPRRSRRRMAGWRSGR